MLSGRFSSFPASLQTFRTRTSRAAGLGGVYVVPILGRLVTS